MDIMGNIWKQLWPVSPPQNLLGLRKSSKIFLAKIGTQRKQVSKNAAESMQP